MHDFNLAFWNYALSITGIFHRTMISVTAQNVHSFITLITCKHTQSLLILLIFFSWEDKKIIFSKCYNYKTVNHINKNVAETRKYNTAFPSMIIFGIITILKQTTIMQKGHFLSGISNYMMYWESKILLIQ